MPHLVIVHRSRALEKFYYHSSYHCNILLLSKVHVETRYYGMSKESLIIKFSWNLYFLEVLKNYRHDIYFEIRNRWSKKVSLNCRKSRAAISRYISFTFIDRRNSVYVSCSWEKVHIQWHTEHVTIIILSIINKRKTNKVSRCRTNFKLDWHSRLIANWKWEFYEYSINRPYILLNWS